MNWKLVLVILLIAGCAVEEREDVRIQMKWLHQAQFAGIYTAIHKGYYDDVNLTLIEGGAERPPIDQVLSGKAQFGIAGADDLVVARSQGSPVKAIGVIYKTSPVVYIVKNDSGINTPHDFIGRTVGVKGGVGTRYSYLAMLEKLGISQNSVHEVRVGSDPAPFIQDDVDIWPGFRINEPISLEKQGIIVHEIYPEDYGVDIYADVLFTTEEMIDKDPELVGYITEATLKGWQYTISHPKEAIEYTMLYSEDLDHQEQMLARSIPLIHTADSKLGYMEEQRWESLVGMLVDVGAIEDTILPHSIYTNEFI